MKRWGRRDFIRAAGVFSVATGLVNLMPLLRASAAPGGRKRILFLATAQGTDMPTWQPSGEDLATSLSYQLEPLAPYTDNFLVLDGIDNIAALQGDSQGVPANGGHEGVGCTLTGTPGRLVDGLLVANGASVDEIIARGLQQRAIQAGSVGAPIPALRIGFPKNPATRPLPDAPGSSSTVGSFFWLEPHVSAPVHWGPWYAYQALFADLSGDPEALDRLRAERRSVLDAVTAEIGRVRKELPDEDRDRMDAHLDGIRALEQGLDQLVDCSPPEVGESPTSNIGNWNSGPNDDLIVRTTFQVIAQALTCGMTDVACYMMRGQEGVADALRYDPLYADKYSDDEGLDLHSLAHRMPAGNPDLEATPEERTFARQAMADLGQWRTHRFKRDFLDILPPEVRDELLVVSLSEMSEGGTHSNYNIPLTIFQGDGIQHFQTGRALQFGGFDVFENFRPSDDPGKPITQLLVSLCHAMGLHDIDSVGDSAYPSGPLTEVEL